MKKCTYPQKSAKCLIFVKGPWYTRVLQATYENVSIPCVIPLNMCTNVECVFLWVQTVAKLDFLGSQKEIAESRKELQFFPRVQVTTCYSYLSVLNMTFLRPVRNGSTWDAFVEVNTEHTSH